LDNPAIRVHEMWGHVAAVHRNQTESPPQGKLQHIEAPSVTATVLYSIDPANRTHRFYRLDVQQRVKDRRGYARHAGERRL
jgi:hypothetical protein